jgi:hypothetical protein
MLPFHLPMISTKGKRFQPIHFNNTTIVKKYVATLINYIDPYMKVQSSPSLKTCIHELSSSLFKDVFLKTQKK